MDLRNLRRWYLFNNGLKSYNKRRKARLSDTQVFILAALYFLNGKGRLPSINGIHEYLNQYGKSLSYGWVRKSIYVLIDLGLIRKISGLKITRCSLTISGKMELMLLEKILRLERLGI